MLQMARHPVELALAAGTHHIHTDVLGRAPWPACLVQVDLKNFLLVLIHQLVAGLLNMICVRITVPHLYILAQVQNLPIEALTAISHRVLEVWPSVARSNIAPGYVVEVAKNFCASPALGEWHRGWNLRADPKHILANHSLAPHVMLGHETLAMLLQAVLPMHWMHAVDDSSHHRFLFPMEQDLTPLSNVGREVLILLPVTKGPRDLFGSLVPVSVIQRPFAICHVQLFVVTLAECMQATMQFLHHRLAGIAHLRLAREDAHPCSDVRECRRMYCADLVCPCCWDGLPLGRMCHRPLF